VLARRGRVAPVRDTEIAAPETVAAADVGPEPGPAPGSAPRPTGSLARDIVGATMATLAMLAVSYADLILARHLLTADQSGAYAVGAVLTKGALWAPQVVSMVALPRLAQGSRTTLIASLAIVGACGAVLVSAAAVAGGLAISMAGGEAYSYLGRYAAGFGAVGALYAVVFVLVNVEIAARVRWPAAPLFVTLVGLGVAGVLMNPSTVGGVLRLSLICAGVALVLMAVRLVRPAGRASFASPP